MRNIKILTIIILSLASFATLTKAQTTTTFVAGMKAPVKIIYAQPQGYFLVSEAGDAVPNNGRVSIVTNAGARLTLLDGLPSGPATPNNDTSGPSALWLNGNTLYIAISAGNSVLNGPIPGTEIPNPHPNSPLFSSVLELQFHSTGVPLDNYNYQLLPADHSRLANGQTIVLGGGKGRPIALLRVAANFPDFTPNPIPPFPGNVRTSNPFGLVLTANTLYVADASQNMIRTVNLAGGAIGTFFTYPPRPNPGMPPPPFIEAVPSGLRLFNNQLLVPLLTGFPFISQFAEIRSIDLNTGTDSLFIGGLTSAIDVLPVSAGGFCHLVYTLEFSTNLLMGAPGRLQRFVSPTTSTVIVNNLISPTSMALHSPSGDIFVTEIFTGRIIRVALAP